MIRNFHSAPHSLVQSAVAAVAQQPGSRLASEPDLLTRVSDLLHSMPHPSQMDPKVVAENAGKLGVPVLSATCFELLLLYAYAVVRENELLKRAMRDVIHMSGCDPGWMVALASYIDFVWSGKTIPYVAPASPSDPVFVLPLPEQDAFRIGIISDWGSGDDAAANVIRNLGALKPDLILHLGDVYYSGTGPEFQTNFVDLLDRYAPGIPVYNLAGNHDMYSGGSAYYDVLRTLNQRRAFCDGSPAAKQPGSFFSLQNSWLQLQGMDTGYHDSDLFDVQEDTTWLQDPEAAWHAYWLGQAREKGRTAFLFSHHQAWTRFATIAGTGDFAGQTLCYNARMGQQLQGIEPGAVRAWFWGHEHVLEVYDANSIANSTQIPPAYVSLSQLFPWVPYAACVGHAGYTMLESDNPYEPYWITTDVPEATLPFNAGYQLGSSSPPDSTDQIFDRGFALLDVHKKGESSVTYYRVPGWVAADRAKWPDATPMQPAPSMISTPGS